MTEPIDGSDDAHRAGRLEKLGAQIKRARDDAGLTQAQLGEQLAPFLGEVVPQTTFSRWEKGTVSTDLETVRAIEMALGLALGTLGRRAGYAEPREDTSARGLVTAYVPDVDDAFERMKAAELLGLGVRVRYRYVPVATVEDRDEHYETEWVVELFDEAPHESRY